MNQQGQGGAPPLHWRRRASVLLGVCALMGAAACSDVPTAAEPSARAEAMEALERSAGRGVGGGTVEVVCSISYATHGGPYAYQYGRITVKLPAASRAADGSTRQYRFRNHAGTQIVGAANCTIPATELAAAHMDRFFGVKQRGGRRVQPSGGGAVLMGGDTHMLPTIHVKACQYGGEYPYCDPPPIDWEKNGSQKEQQVCRTDCGGGGGGPGGDSPEPPPLPEEEPEPCESGVGPLDDPVVGAGFKELWKLSNADAPNLADRHERFGWLVKTATGYRVEIWSHVGSFCGANLPSIPWPPEGPGAVIGFVHTHPYEVGESVVVCDENMQIVGIEEYQGEPSTPDRQTSVIFGADLERTIPLPGIILDKNGIRLFLGMDKASDETRPRCPY